MPQLESESIRNSNNLFLSLTLNDFSVKQYDVRLRLSIESNGVSITTSNLTNFKRFTLIPGIPIVITSRDLADYFDVSTLDFNGIDKTQFLEQGILPEGNYRLCFTAIDAQADGINPVSNKDCDILSLIPFVFDNAV
ncbi:MAG: TANFOR domain-containing protein [Halioglobus sp.]